MTKTAHLRPIQYVHLPDGRITLDGLPNVQVRTILEQAPYKGAMGNRSLVYRPTTKNGRRWRDRGSLISGRSIRFVLTDVSVTRPLMVGARDGY